MANRQGRAQPLNHIHRWPRKISESLPGCAGERLDVPPLRLTVKGVVDQRGLPRSRNTGDRYDPPAGYIHIEVLKVVLTGTSNPDLLIHTRHLLSAQQL